MLLKVGDLARRTGLTVRTLHHYDEIGLLKPSARSESGYRLYNHDDVARLHGIQALRHMGLALADIGGLLDGGTEPDRILAQQIHALDTQISNASELRGRLTLMRDGLLSGTAPGLTDWLDALSLMATYGRYFSAAELKGILQNWKNAEPEWKTLMGEVRAAMDGATLPESAQAQPLVARWMSLSLQWMGGDFDLIERWTRMYESEPQAVGRANSPPADMVAWVNRGVALRVALLGKYVAPVDLRQMGQVPLAQWRTLDAQVQALIAQDEPPDGRRAREVQRRWQALMDTLVGRNPALAAGLVRAWQEEPLLRAGSALSPATRDYLALVREQSA